MKVKPLKYTQLLFMKLTRATVGKTHFKQIAEDLKSLGT